MFVGFEFLSSLIRIGCRKVNYVPPEIMILSGLQDATPWEIVLCSKEYIFCSTFTPKQREIFL